MTPQETLLTMHEPLKADLAAGDDVCAVCSRECGDMCVMLSSIPDELRKLIRANAPGRTDFDWVCDRCDGLFERAKEHIIKDAAVQKDGSHVLSTPLRLDADDRFTGKGVTIAFLDSGFYPHVDLTTPTNRILAYRNMLHDESDVTSLFEPDVASWHGMMTSVVA